METDLKEKLEKQEAEELLEKQKDDICPYCGIRTESFPYIMFEPHFGWLECPNCGIIFSPLSVRKQKLENLSRSITVPKLVVPGR